MKERSKNGSNVVLCNVYDNTCFRITRFFVYRLVSYIGDEFWPKESVKKENLVRKDQSKDIL